MSVKIQNINLWNFNGMAWHPNHSAFSPIFMGTYWISTMYQAVEGCSIHRRQSLIPDFLILPWNVLLCLEWILSVLPSLPRGQPLNCYFTDYREQSIALSTASPSSIPSASAMWHFLTTCGISYNCVLSFW